MPRKILEQYNKDVPYSSYADPLQSSSSTGSTNPDSNSDNEDDFQPNDSRNGPRLEYDEEVN